MDKGRHPIVTRAWTVERTKVRPPQPVQLRRTAVEGSFERRRKTTPVGRFTPERRRLEGR